MQDGTYPPRNFATFGPSGLQPPFTGTYFENVILQSFILQHWAGVRTYTSFFILQNPVFLVNSRYPQFYDAIASPPYSEVTELICRVPSIMLFCRLSILNLLTSVGFHTINCY